MQLEKVGANSGNSNGKKNLHFVPENNASGTFLMSRRERKIRLHCLQITQRKNLKFPQHFLPSGEFLIAVKSEVE